MSLNLDRILNQLNRVFHSEADLQHALAWQIHEELTQAEIRLERPVEPSETANNLGVIHLDLWIRTEEQRIPVELKYKTTSLKGRSSDEIFKLKSHGAHPPNRFDIVADLERIEAVVEEGDLANGYVLVLTNDSAYWKQPSQNVIDSDFRLHNKLSGELKWSDDASQSTKTAKRDRVIKLQDDYYLDWKNYSFEHPSTVMEGSDDFRYLLIEV